MTIQKFDRAKGVYQFELQTIDTTLHAHPAAEIIFALNGHFTLYTPTTFFKKVTFAIIEPNLNHRIIATQGKFRILMLECNRAHLQETLLTFNYSLNEGVYKESIQKERKEFMDVLAHMYSNTSLPIAQDEKVQRCLQYLNSSSSSYHKMLSELKSITHLSDSRLSHLFKEEMGLSIKKYLVWSKLKMAFERVVHEQQNMYEASIASGFYDQPHLSKAFKQLLGINPSLVYNSRTLQK